ncbi:MAG: NAD-glutamate dehydrogenase, partial [Mycobacterium leprae]
MDLGTWPAGRLDEAKADLLERVAELTVHGHAAGYRGQVPVTEAYLRRYYRHVAPEDLLGRDALDVYGAAMSHYQLALHRRHGESKIRVFTPELDEHGWESGHTVIEVVADDMPFLVDSVTSELTRQGYGIHLVAHPQLAVRRTPSGELVEVRDRGEGYRDPDMIVESWIHVEIDRHTDRAVLDELRGDLQRVLADVRSAVEDWNAMRKQAQRIADELGTSPPGLPESDVLEARELLTWLADNHFTFLGYREYDLVDEDGEDVLRPVPGTGLGILRERGETASRSFAKLPPEVRAKARERRLLVLTKANSRATVHRPAYLDYVGVKRFDPRTGEVVGERRFVGLYSSAAYNESIARIPVLRRKVADVLSRAGFSPGSHSGRDLLEILETYPRDELFQISVEDLFDVATGVLGLQERRQVRLFVRRDDYGRFLSCLVYLPRDRYTTDVRLRMQSILLRELHGTSVDYTTRVSESVLARLHFVVRTEPGHVPDFDVSDIQRRLAEATRSWTDDLTDAVVEQCGEERAAPLLRRYDSAFPEAYKEDFPARAAVADLKRLEELRTPDDIGMSLYTPFGAPEDLRRFKIFRIGRAMSLSEVLPLLQKMGVEVIDERPYEIARADAPVAWVYDFGLRQQDGAAVDTDAVKELFQDAFAAAWRGDVENDGFNTLVLRAGMTWRQAVVLRAYAKYLRQAGTAFSQNYIESTVNGNPAVARMLLELFETRFDPARPQCHEPECREERTAALVERIERALDDVESLDEDRILRSYLSLVQATLRTNHYQSSHYQSGPDGAPPAHLSLKFDPTRIPDLPLPRPRFEIFVYSPRVEGVHLRFGPVARGGLRWSDRREDFRTEVLGLVKAQMVKNAVIVPVGAKGGLVVKRPPPGGDRDRLMAEVVACYRTFICGLLDLTDNLVDGQVAPPGDVVRHDGDDTYLVVAADKGTATFSDIANGIAKEYGFWLGDAFASGGSAGYDHKAMGITARGAWESVKRHFRELGVDTQTRDFTVVGIGDMSGDVFGNGMLLSEHIRLVAAFDHRHVFLDPTPDAAASYAERRRLFALPRSSWADYDPALISSGGGVWPRSAKSIPVSPEAATALGIEPGAYPPADVIRAILRAPADLLWNGGIGTYVKASTESNAAVGDKSNDAVRVDGRELRCRVVGEGGNLGFTQLGR